MTSRGGKDIRTRGPFASPNIRKGCHFFWENLGNWRRETAPWSIYKGREKPGVLSGRDRRDNRKGQTKGEPSGNVSPTVTLNKGKGPAKWPSEKPGKIRPQSESRESLWRHAMKRATGKGRVGPAFRRCSTGEMKFSLCFKTLWRCAQSAANFSLLLPKPTSYIHQLSLTCRIPGSHYL